MALLAHCSILIAVIRLGQTRYEVVLYFKFQAQKGSKRFG